MEPTFLTAIRGVTRNAGSDVDCGQVSMRRLVGRKGARQSGFAAADHARVTVWVGPGMNNSRPKSQALHICPNGAVATRVGERRGT